MSWEVRYVEKPITSSCCGEQGLGCTDLDRAEGLSKVDLSKDYPGSQEKVWKDGF